MTKREVASLACKLLSIYAIISAFGVLITSFQSIYYAFIFSSSSMRSNLSSLVWPLLIVTSPFTLLVVFAIGLWLLSDGLANAMVKDGHEAVGPVSLIGYDIPVLSISILGLMSLSSGVPRLLSYLAQYFIQQSSTVLKPQMHLMATLEIVSSTAQIAVGLVLLLGAHRVAQMFRLPPAMSSGHLPATVQNTLTPSGPITPAQTTPAQTTPEPTIPLDA